MKKLDFSVLLICIMALFSAGCANSAPSKIYLNGEIQSTVEVNSEYKDPGVTYPKDYTLIVYGGVDTSFLGRHRLKYSIFAKDGSLAKELYRFVNVVDTTAPTFDEKPDTSFYTGIVYTLGDFVSYHDNYDKPEKLSISPANVKFESTGNNKVNFILRDSSNNETTFSRTINVALNIEKLIDSVYGSSSFYVTKSTTSYGERHTHVRIDSVKSLGYFSSGSLHYSETVPTKLGGSASIQISAKYGEFNNANISFHISGNNYDVYSVGFAYFDATQKYSALSIKKFSSTINNLNLNENSMLDELNENLLTVLNNFQTYMKETLHLEVK